MRDATNYTYDCAHIRSISMGRGIEVWENSKISTPYYALAIQKEQLHRKIQLADHALGLLNKLRDSIEWQAVFRLSVKSLCYYG